MVSTRGVKLKFFEGERVLCYEPDPTKAKVLYDSKVLDVVVNKDQRGRKNVEYLIHFQGWNSSWDRCVSEEYVLKDTAENRQLQKDLAEKAQLQLGAYLYRRERKKHGRKTSEPVAHSSEDGSSGSPARMDTDDGQGPTSSSEEDSSVEEDFVPVELPQDLRQILEQDYFMINTKNKHLKTPAEPNVITILDTYWQHYVTNKLYGMNDKPNTRHRQPFNQQKTKPEDLQKNINICKEVLDGIRIYFDFTLKDLLLYKREQGRIETQQAVLTPHNQEIKTESTRLLVKLKLEDIGYAHLPNVGMDEEQDGDSTNQKYATRRRGLRSECSLDSSNGVTETNNNNKSCSSVSSTNNIETPPSMAKALAWKLIPDYVYQQKPPPPSLVYGATHLLRLFVKFPELLTVSSMPEEKLKVLLRHLDFFIDFLNEHKEWYSEKNYVD